MVFCSIATQTKAWAWAGQRASPRPREVKQHPRGHTATGATAPWKAPPRFPSSCWVTKPLSCLGLFPMWKVKRLEQCSLGFLLALIQQPLWTPGERSDNIGFVHFSFILLAFKWLCTVILQWLKSRFNVVNFWMLNYTAIRGINPTLWYGILF